MRIVYAGSPDVSVIPLLSILQKKHTGKKCDGTKCKEITHEIVGVLTNPPSAQGRSKKLIPTPVAQVVLDNPAYAHIPVLTPGRLDEAARNAIAELRPDILVCFAYGKIFGPKFLALFPKGGINVHPSLLPKYRGCAPVPMAILNRDTQTGVTIQKIALEMDCGDILAQEIIELDGTETGDSLLHRSAEIAAPLLLEVLDAIEAGTAKGVVQDGGKACYSEMFTKTDGCIDWSSSALDIDAKIRAFTPWPGTFTYAHGQSLKILKASVYSSSAEQKELWRGKSPGTVLGKDNAYGILFQTGDGVLVVEELQWHTKRAMHWKDFLNGTRDFIGSICADDES